MTVPLELDGAAAVLTGAGSGIGRATALSLGRSGRPGRGQRPRRRPGRGRPPSLIAAAGGEAAALGVDVSDQQDLEALRDRVSSGSVGSTSS